jgi:hypothetical protein
MNFAATPFPPRFDGETNQICWIDRCSPAQEIISGALATVLEQLTQFLPADHDLNNVLLDDDTPKESTEEVPKVIRGKRGQARGEFFGSDDQVSNNGWTLTDPGKR